jgi:hypothetical protein
MRKLPSSHSSTAEVQGCLEAAWQHRPLPSVKYARVIEVAPFWYSISDPREQIHHVYAGIRDQPRVRIRKGKVSSCGHSTPIVQGRRAQLEQEHHQRSGIDEGRDDGKYR